MGFVEVLTIVLIVLKACGVISWSWWAVFLPEIIAFAVYVIIHVAIAIDNHKLRKKFEKRWGRYPF